MPTKAEKSAFFIVHWILFYAVIELVNRTLEQSWYRWLALSAGFFLVSFGLMRVRSQYISKFK